LSSLEVLNLRARGNAEIPRALFKEEKNFVVIAALKLMYCTTVQIILDCETWHMVIRHDQGGQNTF